MDILQETVKYIEELEQRLLSQVQAVGLPAKLAKHHNSVAAVSSLTSTPTTTSVTSNVTTAGVGGSDGRAAGTKVGLGGLKIHELRNLVHSSLQPALHDKLAKAKHEDEVNIQRLLQQAEATCTTPINTSQQASS